MYKALEHFRQAVANDPNYALAHCGLADTYILMYRAHYGPPEETKEKARQAVAKALQLDNTLAEAHTAHAWLLHNLEKDYESAEREFREAIALKPGYATAHQWYSGFLNERNRLDEALREVEEALRLDPLSVAAISNMIWVKMRLWCWEEVRQLFELALELQPENENTRAFYGSFLIRMGQAEMGEAEIRKAVESAPDAVQPNFTLGYGFYVTRRYEEAVQQLKKTTAIAPHLQWARILLGLSLLRLGKDDEGEEALAEARKMSPEPESDLFLDLLLAPVRYKEGKSGSALQVLKKAMAEVEKEEFSPYWTAVICFALDMPNDGFEHLDIAFARHEYNLGSVKVDPAFDGMRDDPRFKQLLAKMGLTERSSQDR
jgi:Tfp pilus assembly protein PilF